MRTFAEFLVDVAIFPSQGLDIFSELRNFLSFKLGQLGLLVNLFLKAL